MNDRIRLLPVILAFMALCFPSQLFAATGHVKFWVVTSTGQIVCTKETTPPPGATTLDIGQRCLTPAGAPLITITPNSGSTAALTLDNSTDTSTDAWSMPYNISITADALIDHVTNSLHLIFLREAAPNPSAGTYYKTWVKGGIDNGTGEIHVIGSVKRLSNPVVTLTIGTVNVSAGNGSTFEASALAPWSGTIGTSNRELQVDVELYHLDQGATVNLSLQGGGWIKLRAQPGPDNPDPPVVCHHSGNWLFTTTCVTLHKLGYPTNVIFDSTYRDAQVARAYEFAQYNWQDLSQDMARGQGEHLSSLAALLNVRTDQLPAFFELAQEKYRESAGTEPPEQVVASLYETWGRSYGVVN